jgi:hypothetical protein
MEDWHNKINKDGNGNFCHLFWLHEFLLPYGLWEGGTMAEISENQPAWECPRPSVQLIKFIGVCQLWLYGPDSSFLFGP